MGDVVDDFVPQTPRSRDVSTPTDFAEDYGKGGSNCNLFDTSNVLAWLQSPTAHGLFSPGGGLGSLMNTPAGNAMPRTPRTPTVSTSFFFSDVASLPKTTETTPKPDGAKSQKGGSNIICISPLASTKGRPDNTVSINTPLNFKDIFASPKERGKPLPLLGDTPCRTERPRGKQRKGKRGDPSLDAVHLAERDLYEDEDLNVLLQLASNTPGVGDTSNGVVFRSPPGLNKKGDAAEANGDSTFSGLALPMIGGDNDGETSNKTRLQQKSGGRSALTDETFGLPQLGMRSSSSSGSTSKEIKSKPSTVGSSNKVLNDKSNSKEKNVNSSSAMKSSASGSLPNPYHMAPPFPPGPADMHAYYPMSGMPPVPPNSTGSMRVVVGGQPPSRRNSTGGTNNNSSNGSGKERQGNSPPPHPPFHEYPPAPGNMPYPPPPPGMFSTYPAYNGMGRYPPYSHYPPPPPRPMPMYNAQRPTSAGSATSTKDVKRKGTGSTKGVGSVGPKGIPQGVNKRAAPPSIGKHEGETVAPAGLVTSTGIPSSGASSSPNKKQKKSPGDRPTKKKNRSPPLTDRGDREKAAATIHSVNQASGGKNDRAAALAAAILRGVTMRPSGKWQAQLYFAGKSRYIGVFDTREKAALAYEIAREKLKSGPSEGGLSAKSTENLVNTARKAAFDGVNESLPK